MCVCYTHGVEKMKNIRIVIDDKMYRLWTRNKNNLTWVEWIEQNRSNCDYVSVKK